MVHVGVDLHKRMSQISFLGPARRTLYVMLDVFRGFSGPGLEPRGHIRLRACHLNSDVAGEVDTETMLRTILRGIGVSAGE